MIRYAYEERVDRSKKDYDRPFGSSEVDLAPLPRRPWADMAHPLVDELEPGFEVSAWVSSLDRAELSGSDRVALLRAHQRLISHYQAELYDDMLAIKELLHDQEGIEEHAAAALAAEAEIQTALSWTRRRTESELAFAIDLRHRLPHVLAALGRGDIDVARARAIDRGTAHLETAAAQRIADEILSEATHLTTGEITARIGRLAISAEPEDARRRLALAHEARRVVMQPTVDGTAHVNGLDLSPSEAVAITRRINRLARRARSAEDTRTVDQLKADVFVDLLLGRSEAVQHRGTSGSVADVEIRVDLTTLMALDDRPAELAGFGPVIAEIARDMALGADPSRWRHVVTDPVTGRPLASGPIRRRPSAQQARAVRAVAPTCVFPGCRAPARDCDLDHTRAWASGGETSEDNLAPLCRRDHRVKTEAGWTYECEPDGGVAWCSPLGRRYRRAPPSP